MLAGAGVLELFRLDNLIAWTERGTSRRSTWIAAWHLNRGYTRVESVIVRIGTPLRVEDAVSITHVQGNHKAFERGGHFGGSIGGAVPAVSDAVKIPTHVSQVSSMEKKLGENCGTIFLPPRLGQLTATTGKVQVYMS